MNIEWFAVEVRKFPSEAFKDIYFRRIFVSWRLEDITFLPYEFMFEGFHSRLTKFLFRFILTRVANNSIPVEPEICTHRTSVVEMDKLRLQWISVAI